MLDFCVACSSRRGEDDSFDEAMERSRQRYLKDEIECLERTLAKRQAQLREAERMLKDTNNDLKEAKEQVSEKCSCLALSMCVCS